MSIIKPIDKIDETDYTEYYYITNFITDAGWMLNACLKHNYNTTINKKIEKNN